MTQKLTARETLERALAFVPWIASQGGTASVEEVCRRFDLDVDQLSSCLATVSMVGVYPYTPDALLEAFVEPDHVYVNLPDYFHRPLRLTPTQTFGLIAAGRALLSVPGADNDGPLARALAKIISISGAETAVAIDIDTAPSDILMILQKATTDHQQIEIEYYTFARDVWSVRVIDPWRVQALEGNWYLEGLCHKASATRVFRVDRIRAISVLESSFEPPAPMMQRCRGSRLTSLLLERGWQPSTRWSRPCCLITAQRGSRWLSPPARGLSDSCSASATTQLWSTLDPAWNTHVPAQRAESSSGT
jgi:proteasome accessory factor C